MKVTIIGNFFIFNYKLTLACFLLHGLAEPNKKLKWQNVLH